MIIVFLLTTEFSSLVNNLQDLNSFVLPVDNR